MAEKKTFKCPICSNQVDKEQATQIGNRWYCNGNCVSKKQEQLKESEHYRDLIMYLCNLCDVKAPYSVWLAVIKKYKEDYKYTSKGIMLTLKYCYEIKNNKIKEDINVLGLVPYNYERAKEEYNERLKARKATRQFLQSGEKLVEHETIVIGYFNEPNNSAKRKNIDISKII